MGKLSPILVKKRLDKLRSARSLWEDHWREIADQMQIGRNDIRAHFSPGTKRNTHLLNNTAMMSSQLLASALHSELTNPNTQWFELVLRKNGVIDDVTANKDSVKKWLQDVSQRMNDVFNNSNFQTEIHQYYLDITTICTAALLVEEDEDFVVRFSSKHIKTLYISENNKGIIDEVYREWEWDAQTIVQEFGSKAVPEAVIKSWKEGGDKKFKVIHAVYPSVVDPDGSDNDSFSLPFISQHLVDDSGVSIDEVLVEGFNEMPYIVSRWQTYSGEVYGRGPGFTALPEARIVNKMTETIIKASQKNCRPSLASA